MRTPLNPDELQQAIAQALMSYMREFGRIKRIERGLMRKAITHIYQQEEGLPVPEGAAMEAQIDLLEALLDAGQHNYERRCIIAPG